MGIFRDIFEMLRDGDIADVVFDPLQRLDKRLDGRDKTYSSMSRRAAEGTMQFPLIMSRTIGFEPAQRVSGACEKNAASFAQIVLTMNPQLDTSKGDIIEYLRDFHQNSDTSDDFVSDVHSLGESYKVKLQVFNTSDRGLQILKEELAIYGADYREGKINDSVKSKYIKDNKFIIPLTESQIVEAFKEKYQAVLERKSFKVPPKSASGDTILHIDGPTIHMKNEPASINLNAGGGGKRNNGTLPEGGGDQIVLRDLLKDNDVKKANELVPVLLHIRVIASDSTGKSDINKYVDFVVGVKCTIHPVNSDEMIDNLVDACRNHDGIFKFIKWTTGELSFLTDFLLNINESKRDVAKQAGGASPWWNRLKHLAVLAGVKKSTFVSKRILPNASIVVSQEEVDFIKNTYGFDLNKPDFVKKIMDKYFLFCFIIVDDAIEVVHFKYDGQNSYQTISYAGLEKENTNSARQFKDILKAVQRI